MKYIKMLGLLTVAAAALMAFAGTASATLTSNGSAYNGTIHATNEGNVSLTGSLSITCETSTVHGDVEENTATTAGGNITKLTFEKCGPSTVTVVKAGSLTAHSSGTNTATVTSSGAVVTVLVHSTFLGTIHCTYVTEGTDIGTLTGSGHKNNVTATATLDITASISREPKTSDFGCGEHATWEGSYKVETPHNLTID